MNHSQLPTSLRIDLRYLMTLLMALVLFPNPSRAEESPINENPLSARAKFLPQEVEAGGTAELQVEIDLVEGYHAYRERFKIGIDEPEGAKVDAPRIAPLVQFKDSVSGAMKEGVERSAVARAIVEIPTGTVPGERKAMIRFTYQACTKEHCLFPKTLQLEAPLRVINGTGAKEHRLDAPSASQPPVAAPGGSTDFEKALGKGKLSAILFVFIAGFLTSLTPCIYPMIPITLAVLGARAQEEGRARSRLRGLILSFVYVLGIATTYSSLGVLAASTGALFGAALSNPSVVTGIAAVFVAMGLSMYGLFELRLPSFLTNGLGATKTQQGFIGAYLTGLIAGVVASPCVGPVLVFVLTYIAQTQDRLLGFLLLFSFALGMGVLFMLLGAFSHLVKKIPKSGAWMEAVKFVFGTTMVGMALYYVRPIYPDWLFGSLAALALVLISSAYGAFESNEHLRSGTAHVRKGLALASFLIGTALGFHSLSLALGFSSNSPASTSESGSASSVVHLDWTPFNQEALSAAMASGTPVIIDFNAEWCAACKELEAFTFSDARVRERSKEFVLLSVDATNVTPEVKALQQRFKVLGLPTLIFFDSKGRIRDELTLAGFEKADAFLSRMEKTLKAP